MDRLLSKIAKMNTEQADIFATVFAAWNDFVIAARQGEGDKKTREGIPVPRMVREGIHAPADSRRSGPTDEQIINEVREHWHESKKRFTPVRLQECIDWLRKERFVPTGRGPSTRS